MDKRLELQALLEETLGSKNVYFEPPPDFRMKYPCIRYKRSNIIPTFADNIPYLTQNRYEIIAIYRDPDNDLPKKIAKLPTAYHIRPYIADNLHHDVFMMYY